MDKYIKCNNITEFNFILNYLVDMGYLIDEYFNLYPDFKKKNYIVLIYTDEMIIDWTYTNRAEEYYIEAKYFLRKEKLKRINNV